MAGSWRNCWSGGLRPSIAFAARMRLNRSPTAPFAITIVRFAAALLLADAAWFEVNAYSQTDEIQVYDAVIAEPGKLDLTLHNNFTPLGLKMPAFPGAIIPDKSLNGVPEFGYGIKDWWEGGLYLPLYSISKGHGATLDGFKLRSLFVSPNAADRAFFYGINFEYSVNARYWDVSRFSSEVRPIAGTHLGNWDFIVNPILDTEYSRFKDLEFAPCVRVAYRQSKDWIFAAEEYADFGSISRFHSSNQQAHQLFGVFDWNTKLVNIEAGVGLGLTSATDRLTIKLMLSRDLSW